MKKRALGLLLTVSCIISFAFAANAATVGSRIGKPGDANYQVQCAKIGLKDVMHIFEDQGDFKSVVGQMKEQGKKVSRLHEQQVRVINAKRIDPTHIVVRLAFGGKIDDKGYFVDFQTEDFDVTTATYKEDNTALASGGETIHYLNDQKTPNYEKAVELFGNGMPNKVPGVTKEGKNVMYEVGKSGFYFLLLDPNYMVTHKNDKGEIVTTGYNACGYGIAKRINRWAKWDDLTYTWGSAVGVYPQSCDVNFAEHHPDF